MSAHYTTLRKDSTWPWRNTVNSPAWESVACRNTSGNVCSSYSPDGRTHWDTASVVFWRRHHPTCYQSHSFWSFHDVSKKLETSRCLSIFPSLQKLYFKNSRHIILSFCLRLKHCHSYWLLLFSPPLAYSSPLKPYVCDRLFLHKRMELTIRIGVRCRRTW